jgi:hypothetical protein
MWRHAISVSIAVLVLIALLLPPPFLVVAGLMFFRMGPANALYVFHCGRRRTAFEASLCPPSGMPQPVPTSVGVSSA